MNAEKDVPKSEKQAANARRMTTDQWFAKYGFPPIGGLRWMIFCAKNDPKLRATFLRVGRRIYWDEEKLLCYLEEKNKEALKKEGVK